MENAILDIRHITKSFPGVKALTDVSFSINKGEIHALMGENGAGKSTLIKIITGLYKADSGQLVLDGKPCDFHNTLSAQTQGISTVYQELNMIPMLTVSENIFLGRYPMDKSGINWRAMHAQARKLVEEIGVDIDVTQPLSEFSIAQQQIISILRAISLKSKLLILDEPTSSLDQQEVELLFRIVRDLKAKGSSILFITHRLDEVFRLSDRITVLRDGRYAGTYLTSSLSQYDLITKMIGRKLETVSNYRETKSAQDASPVLELKHIKKLPKIKDVSLTIRKGEIVGLAGLLGSGRTETAQIIFGCDVPDAGEILFEEKPVTITHPQKAVSLGMAYCTENRREEGILPDMSISNNITISSMRRICKAGFINRWAQRELSKEYISRLRIKTPSQEQYIKLLSGGNQQKVLIARWLATKPKLIILDEPTRGIDVGAKREIEELIVEFSSEGISVLFISSEIPELIRNCDRILVLRDGETIGEVSGEEMTEENIMRIIADRGRTDKEANAI